MLHLGEDLCRSLPSATGSRGPISPKSVQRRGLILAGSAGFRSGTFLGSARCVAARDPLPCPTLGTSTSTRQIWPALPVSVRVPQLRGSVGGREHSDFLVEKRNDGVAGCALVNIRFPRRRRPSACTPNAPCCAELGRRRVRRCALAGRGAAVRRGHRRSSCDVDSFPRVSRASPGVFSLTSSRRRTGLPRPPQTRLPTISRAGWHDMRLLICWTARGCTVLDRGARWHSRSGRERRLRLA
jgi:hypothetical protein